MSFIEKKTLWQKNKSAFYKKTRTLLIAGLFLVLLVGVTTTVRAENYGFILSWGSSSSFSHPYSIAADGAGNIYVLDTVNNQIQVFSSFGAFENAWGSGGTGNSQFDHPIGFAIDSQGYIYVADYGNDRIQKFDMEGRFLAIFGSHGSGEGQLVRPTDVALDSEGNIFVLDSGNSRVEKFASDGSFVTAWGTYGVVSSYINTDGQFYNPRGIAIDADGFVYVSDSGNNRIQKFTSEGTFVSKFGVFGDGPGLLYGPAGICVSAYGTLYVADEGHSCIQEFSRDGVFLELWGTRGSGDGQFYFPSDVATDPSGYVYVADTWNNRIQKFQGAVLGNRDLVLNAGWNMVSFPVLPVDSSFTNIFNGKGYYQALTWTGTNYISPIDIEVGKGYWILVLSPTTINIEGRLVSSYTSDLPSGWSMIGSVNGVVNCGSVFSEYYQLLTWSGTSYTTATTIEPGKGYWALVLTPTHITIG